MRRERGGAGRRASDAGRRLPAIAAIALLAASLALISPSTLSAAGSPQRQSAQTFERTSSLDYLLYVPESYDAAGEPVPLLLFLHGAGERGDDPRRLEAHGPPKMIAAGTDFPAIVVSPQAPAGDWWTYRVTDLLALLDEMTEAYNVDEDRIYVTGLSMGGYGTWALLQAAADRFAAAIPICGGGNAALAGYVPAMRELPIRVFHGDADRVVPAQQSIDMVEALREAGATDIQLTLYPGVGHDSWTQTYGDPALWDWLWAQRR